MKTLKCKKCNQHLMQYNVSTDRYSRDIQVIPISENVSLKIESSKEFCEDNSTTDIGYQCNNCKESGFVNLDMGEYGFTER